jgi:hypothetical protein
VKRTHEVGKGDVLLIGASFFYVSEVREPTSPLFPGLVFDTFAWVAGLECWRNISRPISAEYGARWNVLNTEDVERCFPTLPT